MHSLSSSHRTTVAALWRHRILVCLLCLAPTTVSPAAGAPSLTPSRSALLRQSLEADAHDLARLQNDRDVDEAVRRGTLRLLPGNGDYAVKEDVHQAYALPATKRFVEGFAAGYHEHCGEPLVVTSLVRPENRQPRNSSPHSVHPTGMAVDLRLSWSRRCRAWTAGELLDLEEAGIIDAARERRPPHYHVVVYPRALQRHLAAGRPLIGFRVLDPTAPSYRVRRGDSLWSIASVHGTTVDRLRRANSLRSSTIRPGQILSIPGH